MRSRLRAVRPRRRRSRSGGFTIIELMIALTVLLIGISGILAMQVASMRATAYSRHATEASVLAEGLMEELRTLPIESVSATGDESVDARGQAASGPFTRRWAVTWNGTLATIEVRVEWTEHGSEPHAIVLRTQQQGTPP